MSVHAEITPRSPHLDIDALLDDRLIKVIVCCGSGGVDREDHDVTTTVGRPEAKRCGRGGLAHPAGPAADDDLDQPVVKQRVDV